MTQTHISDSSSERGEPLKPPLQLKWFGELFREFPRLMNRPWIILGKGPSFSDRDHFDLSNSGLLGYNRLTLNHAISEVGAAEVAHFIDMEAFDACRESVGKAGAVVMPWIPHVDFRPGKRTLVDWVRHHAKLQQLSAEGRLYFYNLSTARGRRCGAYLVITAKYFSAEAAVGLLAVAGIKTVFSLGVDGGSTYAKEFTQAGMVPLLNGQKAFDKQFWTIDAVAKKHRMTFTRLVGHNTHGVRQESKYAARGAYHWDLYEADEEYRAFVDRVVKWIRTSNGGRTINMDFGCGDGLITQKIGAWGIDSDPVAVELARSKGVVAKVFSVFGMPSHWQDGEWMDGCSLLDVLEHLEDPVLALRQIARVTPTLYITTPLLGHAPISDYHYREWSADGLRILLAGQGWTAAELFVENGKIFGKFTR